MKPDGRFVLDIPNIGSPAARIMMLIEAHLCRPDLFDMQPIEFEQMLRGYFEIVKKDNTDDAICMIHYYLIKKAERPESDTGYFKNRMEE